MGRGAAKTGRSASPPRFRWLRALAPPRAPLHAGKRAGELLQSSKAPGQRPSADAATTPRGVVLKTRGEYTQKSSFTSDDEVPPLRRRKCLRRKRTYTDTGDLGEGATDKKITFPCSICQHEIDLSEIFFHKKIHGAMATLGFHWLGEKKPTRTAMVAQRQVTIANTLTSLTYPEKALERVNHAFELLWKKHLPAYYKIIDNFHRRYIYSKKLYHTLIKSIAVCNDRNSTWRAEMNDKFTVVRNFGNQRNVCFFGLFAGHDGASAADLTSKELPLLFLHQLSTCDPSYQMTPEEQNTINSFCTVFREDYTAIEDVFSTKKRVKIMECEYEDIHKAFAKAFWRMDRLLSLGRKEISRAQWSGCSAVTCMLESKSKSAIDKKNWKRIPDPDVLAQTFPSQKISQLMSGVLHIANTGDVEALLCRNGKGFSLTKEHTTKNINERKRVLQKGAFISSNEPHGLLEGKTTITRGLGFHGNPKLKKFIIPAPRTISVPINNLCQFLILATNGLWEVLDMKEVTALAKTAFQTYKERYFSTKQSTSASSKGPLSSPTNEARISEPESNIHIVFETKPESTQGVSSTRNSKEFLPDPKHSLHFTSNLKNLETFLPEVTNCDTYKEKETRGTNSRDGMPQDSKEKGKKTCTKSFYEGAAEHISQVLVNAAFSAGSRNNITVMVILFKGSEYLFLV
ncbi:PREDICTED: protein phosphatase 2C-like domain-containing protein 1 [Condylura cristata]|uniref:protein phosphatase 2C-like domain-containing protein 1 n=1 Tax=Condylura cristata TaxID=143302 RepID=UPI00033459B8|nr:PREDICTED: protein phosphatase 2C-like domain-containing protein 1 [Condylura cristata]